MKKRFLFLSLLSALVLFYACQKELSFENDNTPSLGTLQSDLSGDCLPKTVAGVYQEGVALTSTNYIEVTVDVVQTGTYVITTDTVNGIYFRGAGLFTTAGMNTVKLTGHGAPLAASISNYTVTYGLTECIVPVTIVPPLSNTQAVFTLDGSPNACMNAVVYGTYTTGTALTAAAADSVVIKVTVTSPGTYTVSATANGMTFAATGVFQTIGSHSVTLLGSGTPGTAGTTTVPVTVGTSTCSFTITVGGPATFTVNCGSASVHGTYTQGVALTTTNNVDISVNVAVIGGYTITGTINGMTFSKAGNFTVTGPQTINLAGTGTPAAAGTFNVPVNSGTTPCNFSITVAPATGPTSDYFPRTTGSNWSYEFDGDANDSVYTKVIPETKTAFGNVFNIFMATDNAAMGFDTLGYFRKAAGTYNRFVNLANYLSFDNDQWVEFTFLKDDQPVAHTWTTAAYPGTIQGTPVSVRIKFTIIQKDATITVRGVPYPNTIVLEERYEANLGTGWVDATVVYGYYRDYYARNVGWLYDEHFDDSDVSDGKMEIRRYQVN